jgi:rhodanese-related sulfurtransferase
MTTKTISPTELNNLLQGKDAPILIDVRSPSEFSAAHVTGAVNLPLGSFSASDLAARFPSVKHLYFICQSGTRSAKACEAVKDGPFDLRSVEGGTAAADAAGLPITRSGHSSISLERQVRIAAGALVLLGAALSVILSPHWILLSGAIGAGLIFAGVTDWCGMALLLARMPWNGRQRR